jgi:copper resistance protein C
MKKLLFLLICTLVLIPTIVSAHTELTGSNPANGAVVKEDLKDIVLTYEGEIESLSTMKLQKDGQDIPLKSVVPKGNQLMGTLPSPLGNGAYTIQWNIAGEDGHPLSGEISFSVDKAEAAAPNTTTKQPETKKEEPKKEEAKPVKSNSETSPSSKTTITLVIVVILLIGLFLLFRRKR